MSSLSSRALYLLALGACATIALRPGTQAEALLELALSPLRLLSGIAAPVGWLSVGSVRAAERRAGELSTEERSQRQELGRDQRRFVLPREEGLRAGRSFEIAEVVGRISDDADRLVVRVPGAASAGAGAVAAGMPVVIGDHFVGRVHGVSRDGSRASVDLLTRRDVFVGAVVEAGLDGAPSIQGPVHLVVGGLARTPGDRAPLLLDVHVPSAEALSGGALARVDEDLSGGGPFDALASGFVLGVLVPLEPSRREPSFGLRSPIDFLSGIYQVAIVAPPRPLAEPPPSAERDDSLEDGLWILARALCRGDPGALREGVELDLGLLAGVRAGAALVAGARLVGRVGNAGLFGCHARLLGDPGLSIPAVARVEGLEQPLILGTLVGLGRPSGARGERCVKLHWDGGSAQVGGDESARRARLFTGAGAEGVPPGLVLGDAWLPQGLGPHVIELELAVDPRELGRMRARRVQREGTGGERGQP